MKKLKIIALFALLLSITFGFSSCLVCLRHDNGYHRGYYKTHHHYNKRVYKPKPTNYYIYKTKPKSKNHKHDDKKNDWNSKK